MLTFEYGIFEGHTNVVGSLENVADELIISRGHIDKRMNLTAHELV